VIVTVSPLSPTVGSTDLSVGDVWTINVRMVDSLGAASPTAPTVTITLPDFSTVAPAAAAVSCGYGLDYTVATAGRYTARVLAAGYGVADFTAYVTAITTAAGMPTIADLKVYLGTYSWTDAQLTDALNAEAAAQRAMCAVPADYGPDLRQALLRRCARNLALRSLPLAVLRGDGEAGDTILPGRDPEVRRLEGPWRRMVFG
jgi:hypothetical protein